MKKFFGPLLMLCMFTISCSEDDAMEEVIEEEVEVELPAEVLNLEVEEFIYAGMDEIYLYKAKVPALGDNYFAEEEDFTNFLAGFDSPQELYEGLQSPDDRFSFMTDNYVALENTFAGKSTTNGMQLAFYSFGNSEILAVVNYVLPNTPAEAQNIKRGDVFTQVDGQKMTVSNYRDLLASQSYTITLAKLENNIISQTDTTVSLNKIEYETNPVYMVKTFDLNGSTVGYLMYNSFTANYDEQLNDAFAELKGKGVTELILDLRYNGGGSVATAVGLAGMVTGQYTDQVFLRQQWNDKYQNAWDEESYIDRFKDQITLNRGQDSQRNVQLNSLGLSTLYVLTTNRTASASELIINGLDPYIDVVQIGTTTTGKFQASITLYDSPNFGRSTANKSHTYAIQPLVYKSANRDGVSDYINGLDPTIEVREDIGNMGVLGNPEEPLLKAALNDIQGIAQPEESASKTKALQMFKFESESGVKNLDYQRMYIENLPNALKRD